MGIRRTIKILSWRASCSALARSAGASLAWIALNFSRYQDAAGIGQGFQPGGNGTPSP
jgi:hypothetical protein